MIYDIRAKDGVKLKDQLTPQDKQKILKFVRRKEEGKGYDLTSYFETQAFKETPSNFIVESVKLTEKTKTEFAVITLDVPGGEGSIRFKVQTRYLKLQERKPKHPVTKMFAEKP